MCIVKLVLRSYSLLVALRVCSAGADDFEPIRLVLCVQAGLPFGHALANFLEVHAN
jgi:hypothetical protein